MFEVRDVTNVSTLVTRLHVNVQDMVFATDRIREVTRDATTDRRGRERRKVNMPFRMLCSHFTGMEANAGMHV